MGSEGPGTGTRLWTPRDGLGTNARLAAWYNEASVEQASGAVPAWYDLSGNGRHLTQGTSSRRPVAGTRTLGPRFALDYQGGDDTLTFQGSIAQPFTVCIAFHSDAAGSGGLTRRYLEGYNTVNAGRALLYENNPNWTMSAGSAVDTGRAISIGDFVHTVIFNGASSFFFENGTNYGGALNPGTGGLDWINIGCDPVFTTDGLDGTIGEVVIWQGALEHASRITNERYLSAKRGIPLAYAACSPPLVFA